MLVTALSSVIATFGLITDSAAVIIGAMLIAPLLTPIMALALAALGGRRALFVRAASTLTVGVTLTLVLSAGLAWTAQQLPFGALSTVPTEVVSRTHPGPFDLVIALAGGAAAAYALVRLEGAAALFGVAIATALLPPLCPIGVGIAMDDMGIATGAATLFATNLVAIVAAATLTFGAQQLRPRRSRSGHYGAILTTGLAVALAIGLAPTAVGVAQQTRAAQEQRLFADSVSAAAAEALNSLLPGATLLTVERHNTGGVLNVRVTAEVPSAPSLATVQAIQATITRRLGRAVHVVFVGLPVVVLDPSSPTPPPSAPSTPTPTSQPTPTPTSTPAPTSSATMPATNTAPWL